MKNQITIPRSQWKNDEKCRQAAAVVCTDTHTFTGFVYCAYGQRLLDTLNEGLPMDQSRTGKYFLTLTDVEVFLPDGRREKVVSTYIRKSNILFVCEKSEFACVTGATDSSNNTYPYRRKESVPVIVRYPFYTLHGKMHNDIFEQLMDTLEGENSFLPVTNIEILPELVIGESKFHFVAVNKDKIAYVAELSPRPPETST